ncbi:LysR family transcriptional regulator [Paenibacillus jiagnxiensis]|uniref:LysR family transcriptional regulator n=1 Tax=Paenibacillus jiagnxiensis TaxID=3228926 RepID=UPI0033A31744
MELTQLEYFITVAKLQHMTNASKALNLTQPALSHAISKLEDELGLPLFDRDGRNIRLNRYGVQFAKRVEEALRSIEGGIQEIREWSDPDTGVVSISYLNILGVDLIPNLVMVYKQEHPKVQFELFQGSLGDVDEHFENGSSDLMITSKESAIMKHEWLTIHKVPLYIVVSAQHTFARQSSPLSLTKLSGEPFVGLKNNCALRSTISTCFDNIGFHLATTYDAEDLVTVAGFIKAGLGVSILPQTPGLELEGLVWIPIAEEGWEWEIGLKWRKDRYLPAAAMEFIEFIRQR